MFRSKLSIKYKTLYILFEFILCLGVTVSVWARDDHNGPHWSYEGKEGPLYWGKLDKALSLCEMGQEQSPIDLPAFAEKAGNRRSGKGKRDKKVARTGVHQMMNSKLSDRHLSLIDNGHTLQVSLKGQDNYFLHMGEKYILKQFHFHSPSEHKVQGNSYPMEIHFVHQNAKGKLLVVARLVKEGAIHPLIQKLWDVYPKKGEEKDLSSGGEFNLGTFLGQSSKSYYHYKGSLTTPPCTEGVQWYVHPVPLEVSKEQLGFFQKHYSNNSRPTQDRNRRRIEMLRD